MFHYNVIVYNPPLDIDGAAPLSGTSGSPDQHHHLHQHHDSYKEVNPLFPEEAEQRWTGCWCPRVLLQLTEGWGFVKSAEDYQVQLNVHQGHLHRQVQRKSHLYPTSSPTLHMYCLLSWRRLHYINATPPRLSHSTHLLFIWIYVCTLFLIFIFIFILLNSAV